MRKSHSLALCIFIYLTTATFSTILNEANDTSTDLSQPSYKFLDPSLAYKILSELDSFRPINNSIYFGAYADAKPLYHIPKFGLKNDPEYCNKHRALFVESPEIVFEQANVVLGKRPVPVMKVLAEIGSDIMPHVGIHMPRKDQKQFLYDISPNANLVYTVPGLHAYKEVGSHFACLSQEVNHIPGHYTLKMKDLFAVMAQKYADKYQDKPQCFSFDKYFPKTWLLHDKESCQDFFAQIKTKAHKKLLKEKQIVYLSKVVNSHRGVGVTPLKALEEAELSAKYQKGALCGEIKQGIIVQQYIHNPLLLSGRKFDFRMYMLIASTNPLMVFYHDGDLRVSLYNYTIDSDDKKVLLTNLDLNKNTYKQAKNGELFHGLDEEGLRHAQQWNFPRLQAHLLEEGVISDPNWLDNYLRPEFKKAMIHLIRMTSLTFLRRSTFYELFGLDFLLDANMNLWFIEGNAGPCLDGSSITIEKDIIKMVRDHFEIVYSLLRSRMKRIVLLVNEMIEKKQTEETENGEFRIKNSNEWKQAFKKVSMNYLEPEYQLSADNSFSLVIDESKEGKEMYMGFIDEECL